MYKINAFLQKRTRQIHAALGWQLTTFRSVLYKILLFSMLGICGLSVAINLFVRDYTGAIVFGVMLLFAMWWISGIANTLQKIEATEYYKYNYVEVYDVSIIANFIVWLLFLLVFHAGAALTYLVTGDFGSAAGEAISLVLMGSWLLLLESFFINVPLDESKSLKESANDYFRNIDKVET